MVDSVVRIDNDTWAKERVVQELLRETKIGNQVMEEYMKNVLKPEQIQAIRDQTSAIEEGFDELSESSSSAPVVSAIRKTNSTFESIKRELGDTLTTIGEQLSTADPRSMFSNLHSNLRYTSRYLEDANDGLANFVKGLTFVVGVFNLSYARLTDLNDAFVTSYAAGARFADGIAGLNLAVGESGMTLQEFTGIMNKYTQSFAVLGGRDVVRLSRRFREITNSGADLMMTQAESQEALMTYADILRMSGRLDQMSTDQIAESSKGFLESINDLSAASGRSREEILRSTKDVLAQPAVQAFMANLEPVAKANLEKSFASLGALGSDLQNEYKDILIAGAAGGEAAIFKVNQNLAQLATQTGQMPQLMRIVDMAMAGQDITVAMKEFYENIKSSNLVQSDLLNTNAQFSPLFAGMRDEFGKLGIATNSLADLQTQAAERNFASVEAMIAYDQKRSQGLLEADSALKKAMSGINAAFNDLVIDVMYPIVVPALKIFAGVIEGLTVPLQLLSSGIRSLSDVLTSMLGETAGGLATSSAVLGGGYLGYRMLKSGARSLFGSRRGGGGGLGMPEGPSLEGFDLPGMERISKSGKLLGPLVESMKGLGSGFGKMIQGVLTGIALGIKAFSGTLGPAVQLAGSIVVIGGAIDLVVAGFGAAMIVVGKGIEFIGDGLLKFNDIDGANLGEVGKGMALLGAGMAALGVGEVVSAWGSIVDGIMSWRKADVKSKLLEYAEIGEPMKIASEGLQAFASAFKNAVDMLNNTTLADSVGTTFDQIKGFLSTDMGGFFGGSPAIIQQVDMLASSIGNLANKTAEFQQAQSGGIVSTTTPVITTNELQKRTLMHYDDQKQSNANMIALLQSANSKLDNINGSITTQTTDLSRSIRDSGKVAGW